MRIAVIGPQNTGKSTFINDFINKFDRYTTPKENYRDLINKEGIPINQETTEGGQRLIRDFIFKQLTANKNKKIIFDRSIVDNYVYTLAQFEKGVIKKDFLKETKNIMYDSFSKIDALVFIPTAVSVQIINDNMRDTDVLFIDVINRMFIEILLTITSKHPIKIVTITGGRDDRIKQVESKLDL